MVVGWIVLIRKQATTHTVFQALGLVVDLLQHEMVEASLAEFGDVEVYGLDVIIA